MVVLGLFSLLALLLSDVLRDLFGSHHRASRQAAVRTEALLHSQAMVSALRGTTLSGVAVGNDSNRPGFSVVPLRTLTAGGQRVWDETLIGYYWDRLSGTLFLREIPPGTLPAGLSFSPSLPPKFDSHQLKTVFEGGRKLSEQVALFEVSIVQTRVRFHLVLETPIAGSASFRHSTVREVMMVSP